MVKQNLVGKNYKKNFQNKKINFCIGRIFSFTDQNQKKPFVIPSLVSKIKCTKKRQVKLSNLNHYRDFLTTEDISLAIKILVNMAKRVFIILVVKGNKFKKNRRNYCKKI